MPGAPRCTYCRKPAVKTDSAEVYGGTSYGLIWLCRPCHAWVGCDRATGEPLGALADAETRLARRQAHAVFDKLWRKCGIDRPIAYQWLRRQKGLAAGHIGQFDAAQCKLLVGLVTRLTGPRLDRLRSEPRERMERLRVVRDTWESVGEVPHDDPETEGFGRDPGQDGE